MDRTSNETEEDDIRWHWAPTLHCTWSPSNRFCPNAAWEVTMSLPTGQKRNPGSARDAAPRTLAYGSSSADSSALGLPSLFRGQWAAPSCRRLHLACGSHISGGCWGGVGCSRRREPGVSAQEGERTRPLTLPSLRGPGSSAGGDGMQVGGGQESTQRSQVPPVPHPLYSYPFCGGTTCSCLVPVITVGPHLGGG